MGIFLYLLYAVARATFKRAVAFSAIASLLFLIWFAYAATLHFTVEPEYRAFQWAKSQALKRDDADLVKLSALLEHVSLKAARQLRSSLEQMPFLPEEWRQKARYEIGFQTRYLLGEADRLAYNQMIVEQARGKKKVTVDRKGAWYTLRSSRDHRPLLKPADIYFAPKSQVKLSEVRGIYLTGTSAGYHLKKYLAYSRKQKINAFVYDIKDVTGYVNYSSTVPWVKKVQGKLKPPISNLQKLHHSLLRQNIFRIARVALFQDERLAKYEPSIRIRRKDGRPLDVKGHIVWVDPGLKKTRDYNLNLIWEVLRNNTDEIQLDYVRYPAEGAWKEAVYAGIRHYKEKPRMLTLFLQQVHSLTKAYHTYLGLDVFGVVSWQENVDIKSTGQDLRLLSQAADVISPMLYPSHFGHVFAGFQNPADYPEHFIGKGVEKTKEIIEPHVIVRPWLQAFAWRVTNYTPEYITKQIEGGHSAGSRGYLLWNARNQYPRYTEPRFKRSPRKSVQKEKSASEDAG